MRPFKTVMLPLKSLCAGSRLLMTKDTEWTAPINRGRKQMKWLLLTGGMTSLSTILPHGWSTTTVDEILKTISERSFRNRKCRNSPALADRLFGEVEGFYLCENNVQKCVWREIKWNRSLKRQKKKMEKCPKKVAPRLNTDRRNIAEWPPESTATNQWPEKMRSPHRISIHRAPATRGRIPHFDFYEFI